MEQAHTNKFYIKKREGWELPDFVMSNSLTVSDSEGLCKLLGVASTEHICRMLPRAMRKTGNGTEYMVVFALRECSQSQNGRPCVFCKNFTKEVSVLITQKNKVETGEWYNRCTGTEFNGYVSGTGIVFSGNYYIEQEYELGITGKMTPPDPFVRAMTHLHVKHVEHFGFEKPYFTEGYGHRLLRDALERKDPEIMRYYGNKSMEERKEPK